MAKRKKLFISLIGKQVTARRLSLDDDSDRTPYSAMGYDSPDLMANSPQGYRVVGGQTTG